MKQLFTSFFFLPALFGFSQDETIWFQEGNEWYYNIYCLQEYGCGYTYYEVGGTDFIGGEESAVLNRIYLDEFSETPFLGAEYLRFENDTVWRYSNLAEEWHMLWDIGAQAGDVWTIQNEVFYGYSHDGLEPDFIPLFQVVVDSVVFWEEVPNSPLTNRRAIYVSPTINQTEVSMYTFGPILEGVGAVGSSHDLIGNSTDVLLPLQSPYFQCFIENGELVYGSDELAYGTGSSPCFALNTTDIPEVRSGLIYPNPAIDRIFWDRPIDEIRIIGPFGKLVHYEIGLKSQSSLSISTIESGFYTLIITEGGNSFSQKLIIE